MKRIKRNNGFPLFFNQEVADALADSRPVVALESNVITHGLRFPHNVETAIAIEQSVRQGGAVPATIFIENGQILIGSDDALIERFATSDSIPKVSSRDLPVVLATGSAGATTVASSLICAELAGIPVFSSAGIGGVHRGAETSMDISADLIQLTRSKVAVVCAGAKNILDLKLTLEFLETHCVPVISWRSDDFPAFFCTSSGLSSPARVDDAQTLAKAVRAHWSVGSPGGLLITVPPRPEDALPTEDVEQAIEEALLQASHNQISGNQLTRYLMRAIEEKTAGRTTKANASVLISTAEKGAELAAALAQPPQ